MHTQLRMVLWYNIVSIEYLVRSLELDRLWPLCRRASWPDPSTSLWWRSIRWTRAAPGCAPTTRPPAWRTWRSAPSRRRSTSWRISGSRHVRHLRTTEKSRSAFCRFVLVFILKIFPKLFKYCFPECVLDLDQWQWCLSSLQGSTIYNMLHTSQLQTQSKLIKIILRLHILVVIIT